MATTKKVAKKATKRTAKKKAVPKNILPAEVTITAEEVVNRLRIKSPLNVEVVLNYCGGDLDYVTVDKVDQKKASYVCSFLETVLENVVGFTDEQFADILSVVETVREANRKQLLLAKARN